MSKKMGIIFICLLAISGLIMFSFKHNAIAQIIARAIPLLFGIYFITQKDFNTKYPKAAGTRPQVIILIVFIIAMTVYQYVIKK
jgi:hypothetical protein